MEEIMISRLRDIMTSIQALTKEGVELNVDTLTSDEQTKAEIICKKLEKLHARFSTELNEYFRLSTEPSVDEISRLSTSQLQSEEILVELTVRLQGSRKTDKHENVSLSSKLPKLNLPEFNGDILQWQQFYDHFSSNIDKRNLPDVDKLLYLKSSLTGDAKKTIEGLETTHKNYQIAMTTLKERYGKPSEIIDAHYSALYKVKAADMTAADCRRTLNEIEKHIRILCSLGENTNQSNLRFMIIEKFPEEIIYEMKRTIKTDSIDDIRKELEVIVSAREESSRIKPENKRKDTAHYTVETLLSKDNEPNRAQSSKFKQPDKGFKRKHFDNRNNQSSSQRFKPYHDRQRVFHTYSHSNDHGRQIKDPTYSHTKNNYRQNKRKFHEDDNQQQRQPEKKKRRLSCNFCQGAHYNDECNVAKTIQERKSRLKNRCFKCLSNGHQSKACKTKRACVHCGNYNHNRALCPKHCSTFKRENSKVMHTYAQQTSGYVTILQTAVVEATQEKNSSIQVRCKLLMDSGSQRTYITQKVAKKLNLPIEEEQHLSVYTFGTDKPQEYYSPLVKLRILTKTNVERIIYANVVPTIAQDLQYPKVGSALWKGKEVLADDGSIDGPIDILIGNDYYFNFILTEKKEIKENLYLINSELGWIISGRLKTNDEQTRDELTIVTYFQSNEGKMQKPDLPLDNVTLKSLWDLESIGIRDSPNTTKEEEAMKNFNDTTKYKDGRYSISWPWKEYPPDLPVNIGLVRGRLISLLKRMNKDSLKSYDNTIREQLDKKIIERVPSHKILQSEYPVHYLAHHGVTAPGKPTRLVYDASAKLKDNKSLNECLHAGPILLEDLTGLLIRFRSHKIALTADVEKAFLQIALEEGSRDVTRFLWIKDISKPATEDNILHLRFCRVPFGIISSPFILNATIKHHLMKSSNKTIQQAANDIYVDNLLTGTMTTIQAITLYNNLKREFQKMSMNLREWSSNSKELKQMIPDSCGENIVKVLGLDWNTQDDTIQLRHKDMNFKATKRSVLKTVASVYDPCGYAAPSVLPSKLFLQELWKKNVKWDSPLPKEMLQEWRDIHGNLTTIQEILPRYYIKDIEQKENQLHCFADASSKAYAAVIYVVNENGKAFVIGKSRLVPIKDQENLKIPRLELLGALIGNRLLQYAEASLQMEIKHHFLWLDSQIVIDWYNSDKLLTPFVTKRIKEIKSNKKLTLRYVPTSMNPADVATRPITSENDRSVWLKGPDFLLQRQNNWPVNLIKGHVCFNREDLLHRINKAEKTAKIRRVETAPEKERNKFSNQDNKIEEIRTIQEKYFPEEVNMKETSLKRNLKLFKDENGILRSKGRLDNADLSYDTKYPILLPKDCNFTNDLILKVHQDNYHVGANHTLSIIRQTYWIPQGKAQVQKILRHCPICVKHGGGPFKLPPTPALPTERANYSSPYTFIGLDYLGPILVKTDNGTEKRWICLFTCLAVRAIHLEIVKDLSAEEGLLALRRMIATRGVPAVITSDNASQFKLISEILNSSYCIKNNIKWKFIPQLAPWFGGFYERLVGLVKHCLKRSLQKHLLKDSQIFTVIKEIEAVLNTRPLTCVDSEMVHILKPADFLTMGKCLTTKMTCNDINMEGTPTKLDLIASWSRALKLLEEFKTMFMNHYLTSLRERFNSSHKEPRITSHLTPRIGQVVQIIGDNKNREDWKVGKITALIKGSDELCRVAKIQVGNKEFTRSISHLYPLEIEEDENQKEHFRQIPNNCSVTTEEELHEITQSCDDTASEVLESETEDSSYNQNNDAMLQTVGGIEFENVTVDESNESHESLPHQSRLNVKDPEDTLTQSRPRRAAATRALEKIREWTSALITMF